MTTIQAKTAPATPKPPAAAVDVPAWKLEGPRATLRGYTAPWRLPLFVAAELLIVVGSFLPWASFDFGYPGAVSSAGLGGHRLYLLILAVPLLVLLRDVPGRRRVARRASVGIFVISLGNLIFLTHDGGGLGALSIGAWLAVVGGLLAVVVADSLPEDAVAARPIAPPSNAIAILTVLVAVGLSLLLIVIGLNISEATRFSSYLGLLITGGLALQAIGVLPFVSAAAHRQQVVFVAACFAAAVAFPFTQNGNQQWITLAAQIAIYTAAAIGLNVVVGLAGLLDLGYVAFYGIGAYFAALLSNAAFDTVHYHLSFLLVLPLGAIVAGIFGVILGAPTLRLRGDYLAIVTLGFGEIFTITVNNWDGATGGPQGISSIPNLKIGGFSFGDPHTVFGIVIPGEGNYYFLLLLMIVVIAGVFVNLNNSRVGRAWVAIREDELAAQAMGVNTINYKLLAFAIGATLAGLAGTISGHFSTSTTPDSYNFQYSILFLGAVVLGGMGTVPGVVLGMTLLNLIPEKLRFFQDKRLFIFGLALIILMRIRPEGIVPSRRRQREFHGEASGADSSTAPVGSAVAHG